MIRVRDLHKSYPTRFGSKQVLQGIDFDLAAGERLGILGRNGAGKSTLVRLVSGAEKPTSGLVERGMSVSWPLAFGGAFQPQLTGIDNIRFITSIYDQDFERNLAFVEDFAELGPYLREPVRSYSSGMRARLAFAISMIIEFDCFLIDEIGAVGDARFHDRCNRELFERRADRAMIIISHDAGYLREHCNRWAILHDGKLLPFADFDEAYGRYKELIGAEADTPAAPVDFSSRALMIASSQHSALGDERFRALVQQGDWARDERNWELAADDYARALALYPYQRSYWTQLGHMRKEQGRYSEAEIAYRTAVALGEPLADVVEHAEFVIHRQGETGTRPALHLPHSGHGSTADQPPSLPDLEALLWLLNLPSQADPQSTLARLRDHPAIDSLMASLIHLAQGHGTADTGPVSDNSELAQRAACLLGLGSSAPGDRAAMMQRFLASEASRAWPLSFHALSALQSAPAEPHIARQAR